MTDDEISKVPLVGLSFWIVKLMTTAMGEATSDYLVKEFAPALVVVVGFAGFVAALALQFRTKRYVAWVYWLTALMVSVFGTMGADVAHVGLHIPYAVSTVLCAVGLAATFTLWMRTEHTLSIHSITTPRREAFYWTAATMTFALGTATGDLTAVTFKLGYLSSGLLFIGIFLIPAIGYWRFKLNRVFAFWFAYVVTRPLGASFADWVAKPRSSGGLGRGDGFVALILGLGIAAVVAYLAITKADDPQRAELAPAP